VGCCATAPLRYPLRRASGAFGGTGNPRMRVLQDPAAAKKILTRLSPDSCKGVLFLDCLADPDP
jgi:hypothetical protein